MFGNKGVGAGSANEWTIYNASTDPSNQDRDFMPRRKKEAELIAKPSEKSHHTSSISHKRHNDTQHDYPIAKKHNFPSWRQSHIWNAKCPTVFGILYYWYTIVKMDLPYDNSKDLLLFISACFHHTAAQLLNEQSINLLQWPAFPFARNMWLDESQLNKEVTVKMTRRLHKLDDGLSF